jgi:histidine kinase/DNA gyrase B/HSP90-like ATPase
MRLVSAGNGTARQAGGQRVRDVTPSASRLTTSLRDLGYDPPAAIADLVDNALDARARRISIRVEFAGAASRILILDDGAGMTPEILDEALRFGSRRPYGDRELGRFGLGLKTASLSLGRRLTVITRARRRGSPLLMRALDLDHIRKHDRWEVQDLRADQALRRVLEASGGYGTLIVIGNLDRLLNDTRPDSGWSQRRLDTLVRRTGAHLGMVFHRFLEGTAGRRLRVKVNGMRVQSWNPFAVGERHAIRLPENDFELETADGVAAVRVSPVVLPPRSRFSSLEEFERLSGPLKWNRQQGFYVYREHRLIQSGGWCGLRAPDEHTKLARLALDFPSQLDELFQINVAKMRVAIPAQLRKLLEEPVHEVCHRADAVYRSEATGDGPSRPAEPGVQRRGEALREVALALSFAATEVGEFATLERIMRRLQKRDARLAREMGWG